MIFSLSEMLKMDDEFATSVIAVLSTLNYYHESPCRSFLMQSLKSSCTVRFLFFLSSGHQNIFIIISRRYVCTVRVYFV